jgi:hypothetical protein
MQKNSKWFIGTSFFLFYKVKKGNVCAKIDLKDAYFHLLLEEKLRPYVALKLPDLFFTNFKVPILSYSPFHNNGYQPWGCFKRNGEKGIIDFIYLDDILVLNITKEGVENDLKNTGGSLIKWHVDKRGKMCFPVLTN